VMLVAGNLLSGFSFDWWRKKHNQLHHTLTNVIGGDEDIDTMPFIAWDEKIAAAAGPSLFVRYQHILTWFSLSLARVFWRYRSIQHVLRERRWSELGFLGLHYTLYAMFVARYQLPWAFIVIADLLGGFLTAFVFVQSHNGKVVTESVAEAGDFWTHQIMCTSNVKPSWFSNFFSGYLNLQIEHHLFPWLARGELLFARTKVKELCRKHNLPYMEYGWWESTMIVYRHLEKIAGARCS
jgi:fatty acid desaturase